MVYNSISAVGRGLNTGEAPKSGTENDLVSNSGRSSIEVSGEKIFSKKELEKNIDAINKWLEANSTHIKFQLHEKLNEYYVQVLNNQTNEIVREIPQKKMLDIVAKMYEMNGLLLDEKR